MNAIEEAVHGKVPKSDALKYMLVIKLKENYNMDDKRAVFLLKNIIEKVKEARKNKKFESHTHFLTFAEEDAINYAITFIENKQENGYISKDEYERRLKEEIQEHCDHDWIKKQWVDACFYEVTCRKCGKVETFYKRD